MIQHEKKMWLTPLYALNSSLHNIVQNFNNQRNNSSSSQWPVRCLAAEWTRWKIWFRVQTLFDINMCFDKIVLNRFTMSLNKRWILIELTLQDKDFLQIIPLTEILKFIGLTTDL